MKNNDKGGKTVTDSRIAIIIPVYNHDQMVVDVVIRALGYGYPVFVVDDGSIDESFSKLRKIEGVHLLQHRINRGKGAALVTGFQAAQSVADWAITMDADGQHNPDDLVNLVQAIPEDGRPIILGRRQGMDNCNVPWTSRFGREFSNFWVWASGGQWLRDSQSGFRIYPLPEILNIGVCSERFQFEVEVLARAGWEKIPVIEVLVGVTYEKPGKRKSHFRPFVDFLRNSQVFTRLILTRIFFQLFRRK
ncbi:MAG: glycosyltransferase family 2 protein [Desulfobacterium sp.]|nr:glycosyltransferase family 2 protein [Desulfobacterium sp.]